MATRPVGNPSIWAQTTNYPAGADPWSGMATKVTAPTGTGVGFTPETGIVSDYMNQELNVESTWIRWLSFGSNLAGLDAHVVETSATGLATIAAMVIGGTAAAIASLTVTENSGASSSAITASNVSGGFAILGTSDGTSAGIRGVSTGTAPGVEGRNTAGGGAGVSGVGNGAGAGVTGTAGATGHGVSGTCTATATAGVSGTSSTSVAASYGLLGTAARNDCAGVVGLATNGAEDPVAATAAAVVGFGENGVAGWFQSSKGYGVWAQGDTAGPLRAALHIEPQDADPTNLLEGDIWYDSGEDQFKGRQDGTTMGLWATGHGYFYLYGEARAQVDEATTAWQDVITETFVSNMEPREANGIATITVCFEFGASSTGPSFQWRVIDVTATAYPFDNGATPADGRIEEVHNSGASANDRYLTQKAKYTIPVAGTRQFKLQIRSIDGAITSRIRRAELEVAGSHG